MFMRSFIALTHWVSMLFNWSNSFRLYSDGVGEEEEEEEEGEEAAVVVESIMSRILVAASCRRLDC